MSQHGVGPRAVSRSVAFLLTAGVLAVPALAGCGSEDPAGKPLAGQDIQPAPRDRITDGGTLRWAVDSVPDTLNTFQSDADATTTRVAQAVLPSMFRMNADGRPEANPAYLESAKVVETEPKQVVLYKLDQQAVWSDGREIGAADFAAQWRALAGKDTAYWTARNAGYDRIQKIERGDNALEVRVTFSRPYADWRSLFSPLYPKDVMGTPDSFNDGARKKLKVTAGPFLVKKLSRKDEQITLTRNPRWWGRPAKLSEIVLRTVPREKRAGELAAGTIDLAEIAPSEARRITVAARPRGSSSPVMGPEADRKPRKAAAKHARQQPALRGFEVRKSLEPAFTQLALNGAEGPLADERVRRAVARALDRKELAKAVLKPLGLPAVPVGSHLALSGQAAYADNSGALGGQDTKEAQALLADAGWVRGGPIKEQKKKGRRRPAPRARRPAGPPRTSPATTTASTSSARTTRTGRTARHTARTTRPTSPRTASSTSSRTRAAPPARTPPWAPPPRRAARPPRSPRTASRSPSASCSPPGPAPRHCARWPTASPACWSASASARRSPRSPTSPTSRTTSRPASTTSPCTPGPPPPSPPPTPAPSTPSPSRPPTVR